MILYHHSFDVYHGVYRYLYILNFLPLKRYEIQRMFIMDFYSVFPANAYNIRFPKQYVRLKNKFKKVLNEYDYIKNYKQVFNNMNSYQFISLKCLASYNLIDTNAFAEGYVLRTLTEVPFAVPSLYRHNMGLDSNVRELLQSFLCKEQLLGVDGLKSRTNLVEFRYDPA